MDGRTNGLSNADRVSRPVPTTPQTGGEGDSALGGGTRMTSGTARSAAHERRALSPGLMSRPLRRLGLRRNGRGGSVGSLTDLQDLVGIGPSGREFSVAGEAAEIKVPIATRSLRPAAPLNDADSGGDDDEASPSMGSGGSGGVGKTHRGPARMVRKLSVGVARRLQGRSAGGSGAMTIGRASLASRGAVQREGLGAPPDFDNSNGNESPHSTSHRRMLPAEWHRPVPSTAVLTPSEDSSAGPSPPPRQQQHHHSNTNPSISTITRGVSAPSDTVPRSHSRRLSGSSIGGLLHQLHPRSPALETSGQRADSAGIGQEAAASATEVEAVHTPPAVAGRSRKLSVSSKRPDRRGSLSPVKRFMAGVAAVAAGVQSPEPSRRRVDPAGMGYEAAASAAVEEAAETASAGGRRRGRLSVGSRRPGRRGSVSPTRVIAGVAAAMAAGTRGGIERDRSTSPRRGDERELVLEENAPTAGDTFPNKAPMVDPLEGSAAEKLDRKVSWHSGTGLPGIGECFVEPAPPSTLKYGDRLRLWARPSSLDLALMHLEGVSASGGGVSSPSGSGYVGSVDRVKRVKKKLFRRSETAAINCSSETIRGFIDCHFKAVDPEGRHPDGEDVRLGQTVLLVDDRGFVWNYNTAGNASSVRMKPRASAKYQAAVYFRLRNEDGQFVGDAPVVFGKDRLEIVPVDQSSSTESRRLRVGSRFSMKYQEHALTAYTKKYSGSSRQSVSVLCGDGRGERLVFEVHLPNASAAGDPSPVVTKVIIHANELQTLAPPLAAVDDEEDALSSDTSPPPGPASEEHAANQPRPRSGSVTSQPRPRSGSVASSGRPRGGSCGDAEPHELVPPLEVRHRRGVVGGSISGNCSKARGTEVPSGQMQSQSHPFEIGPSSAYLSSEGYPSRGSTATMTATSSVRTGSVVDDEDDEDQEDELTMEELMELGTFEGLKWGDYVQFKLPGEGEVSPDDPMLTIMLSNGCSASVSIRQLRENDGRDKFPVSASFLKSVVKRDTLSEGKGGTVYIRCTLTPLACCHGTDEAGADAGAATAAAPLDGDWQKGSRAQGSIEGGGDVSTSDLWKPITKSETAKRWTQTSGSLFFLLASLAAIILSAPAKPPNFLRNSSTPSLSSSGPPAAVTVTTIKAFSSPSCSSTSSPSPSVCTSVWDLRQPDGTEYPHQQLSAAATAFESAGPDPAPTAPAAADDASLLGKGNKNIPSLSPRQEDGSTSGGAHGAGTAAQSGVSITRTGEGVMTSGAGASEGARGGWARACAILVAILAAGVVIVDRLLGSRWAGNARVSSTPAPPMQARVHLLEWDARSISETRAAAEALLADGIYHTPPSESELAPMPNRFAVAENMNMAKAWARWGATLTWRKENAVDYVLSKPHPRFSLIKSLYPHCFHLADKGGRVTYYERPGLSDFAELKKAGITKQDLVEHYVYCMEYLWQVLQPKQSQKVTIIIDLAGVRLRDLVGESVAFLKTTVGIMSRHYPQRSFKILILNAPSFFSTIFSMVKTLLNEATKKKIEVLPVSAAERGMLEVIPPENLPPQYGGTSQVPLLESPAEAALLAHVVKILEKNGQTMEPVMS